MDDGSGEADALFHAGGEAVVGAIGILEHGEHFEDVMDAVAEGGAGPALEFAEEGEGFAGGELGVESGIGGEEADVAAYGFGFADEIVAGDDGGAGGGGEDGGEAAEGGSFAGAVGAQEAVDLAGVAGERDAAGGVDFATVGVFVGFGEAVDFNHEGDKFSKRPESCAYGERAYIPMILSVKGRGNMGKSGHGAGNQIKLPVGGSTKSQREAEAMDAGRLFAYS